MRLSEDEKMTPRCWKTCKIADFPVPGTIRSLFAILTRFMVENKKFLENNMLAMEVVPHIALSEERKTRKSFPFYQQLGECAQRRKREGRCTFLPDKTAAASQNRNHIKADFGISAEK